MLQNDRVELERVTCQRAAEHDRALAELFGDIVDHAIVRRRGRRQDRDARVQQLEDAADPSIVGAEVVTPVRDAVGLVDDEEPDRALDAGQDVRHEPLVGEAFRGDEQDVDRVGREALVDRLPLVDVPGVDRRRAEAQAPGHRDLVAHQGQEWTDDQGGPMASITADACRDPIDEALAPARSLDDESSVALLDHLLDRLALALAKIVLRPEHGPKVLRQEVHRLASVAPSLSPRL